MTPDSQVVIPFFLPQVERYVLQHIPMLTDTMRRMEQRAADDAMILTLDWQIRGRKRPKVRDSRHFANLVCVGLRMHLTAQGFSLASVSSDTSTMTFTLAWHVPRRDSVPTVQEDS